MTEKTLHGLMAVEWQAVISTYEHDLRQSLINELPARRIMELIVLLDKLKFEHQELVRVNEGYGQRAVS